MLSLRSASGQVSDPAPPLETTTKQGLRPVSLPATSFEMSRATCHSVSGCALGAAGALFPVAIAFAASSRTGG
jgi:hypothetical protein